ncbi:MAG: single-stranded DNA-binding protein [Bacteroidales bacterium]|nr:single-stranded DNA-binding protein [Bacteroidales bacterium]
MSVNKVILVGNVGKDPEIRHLENNLVLARFSLATSETYKNRNGEMVTNTEWHNIVAWRQLAELAERFIRKGRQLYVEGKITTRQWDDKEGNKRYTTEIVADNIRLLGKREDIEQNNDSNVRPSRAVTPEPMSEDVDIPNEPDDLPF